MSAQAAASVLSYAESAIIEDDAVAAARGRAEELGATAVS
ncbi:MAG TPA: methyltransferase, partial [Gordonia sp. (in: high G+C Gram-positive bacteria)]|nr:methyltransferase [Gordonia sp. (in: high G+C Gram-positive bacteria)]